MTLSEPLEQRIARLTKRQKECLELVAQGYTAKEIGRTLGISDSTVNNHIQLAIQLLQVGGRAEAGRLYAQHADRDIRQRLPSESDDLVSNTPNNDEFAKGWRGAIPPIGGKQNVLSPSQTILATVRIAFVAALIFIACVIVLKTAFDALS